jgi:hypothetical protein
MQRNNYLEGTGPGSNSNQTVTCCLPVLKSYHLRILRHATWQAGPAATRKEERMATKICLQLSIERGHLSLPIAYTSLSRGPGITQHVQVLLTDRLPSPQDNSRSHTQGGVPRSFSLLHLFASGIKSGSTAAPGGTKPSLAHPTDRQKRKTQPSLLGPRRIHQLPTKAPGSIQENRCRRTTYPPHVCLHFF